MNEKQKKPLTLFSVRMDSSKLRQAQKLGVDVPKLFRDSLDQALFEHSGKCPVCGTSGCKYPTRKA
jgi:hypothetical protein